ncbi:MAG TPA: DUF4870 domain-containing protein [Syntrophomonas sp.]|nr:DUF4870 domain-containing protein [Syntrophomonas sp.]
MDSGDPTERNWAMACHLSAFLAFTGLPLGNVLGPLIVWLLRRDQYPLVDEQGKESLNFQISMSIYAVVGLMVAGILLVTLVFIPLSLLTLLLLGALGVVDMILVVIASLNVSNGQPFQYPFTIKFLK